MDSRTDLIASAFAWAVFDARTALVTGVACPARRLLGMLLPRRQACPREQRRGHATRREKVSAVSDAVLPPLALGPFFCSLFSLRSLRSPR